jgi:Zinc finger, C3HC4 type (RING finger)
MQERARAEAAAAAEAAEAAAAEAAEAEAAAAAEAALIDDEAMDIASSESEDDLQIIEVVQVGQNHVQIQPGFQFRTITLQAVPMAGPAPRGASESQHGVHQRRFIPFVDLVDEDIEWVVGEECVLCMDKPPTVKVEICGHKVYCNGCGERVRNEGGQNLQRCPICMASSLDLEQKLVLVAA